MNKMARPQEWVIENTIGSINKEDVQTASRLGTTSQLLLTVTQMLRYPAKRS